MSTGHSSSTKLAHLPVSGLQASAMSQSSDRQMQAPYRNCPPDAVQESSKNSGIAGNSLLDDWSTGNSLEELVCKSLEELINELEEDSGDGSSVALLTSSLEQATMQINAKGRTIPYLYFIFPYI